MGAEVIEYTVKLAFEYGSICCFHFKRTCTLASVLLSISFMTLVRLKLKRTRLLEEEPFTGSALSQPVHIWILSLFVLFTLECSTTSLATLLNCLKGLQAQTTLWNRLYFFWLRAGRRGSNRKVGFWKTGGPHILTINFFFVDQIRLKSALNCNKNVSIYYANGPGGISALLFCFLYKA